MALGDGTRIGPYEVIAPMGVGGMGEVYKARDTRSGREVVVKILAETASSDLTRRRRFKHEVRALAALDHPNVMAILDAGTHEGQPFLVAELLEGETLRERLQRGPLPPVLAVGIAIQVARGLASAHARGIVHRDLKPSNLFLTANNHVKILDFGIARIARGDDGAPPDATLSDETEAGTILGTAGYMSPEQVRGGTADHRSDVFSLGVVLTEMLTGKQTFPGNSLVERGYATMNADPDLPPHLAPALARVIRRCLAKEPSNRFESALDLAFLLDGIGLGSGDDDITGQYTRTSADRALAQPVAYRRLTFRHGTVRAARFAPDGKGIVLSAKWGDEPFAVYTMLLGLPESQAMTPPDATLLALSSSGELAVSLRCRQQRQFRTRGMLARLPLGGGSPREVLEDVEWADFAPDGRQLLLVRTVDGKNRLEYPVGQVLYETAGWVSNPRFSRTGQHIAFFDHPDWFESRGSLVVVGPAQSTTVLIANWSHVLGLAWSPRGDELWFTGCKEDETEALHAVSLEGRERTLVRAPVALRMHDVSTEGHVLLTTERFRRVARGRFPGRDEEKDMSWFDGTQPADLSTDGKTMVFYEGWEAAGATPVSFLRRTDGAPALCLGEGRVTALSPDGRWVIMIPPGPTPTPLIVPTGAGAPQRMQAHLDVRARFTQRWLPDGRHVLFMGTDDSGEPRVCLYDVDTKESHLVAPPGFLFPRHSSGVSPDGRRFTAVDANDQAYVCSLDGGLPVAIPGWARGDRLLQWAADARAVFVCRTGELPAFVFRLDLASGAREAWKRLAPGDPTGVQAIDGIHVTPDGLYYLYDYCEASSTLYLVANVEDRSPKACTPRSK